MIYWPGLILAINYHPQANEITKGKKILSSQREAFQINIKSLYLIIICQSIMYLHCLVQVRIFGEKKLLYTIGGNVN